MSVQIIWKRFTKNDATLSFVMSLLRLPPINTKPHIKSANFCTETAASSLTPPNRGVVVEFLIKKCGLTDEDIRKAFRHCDHLLRAKSDQNMEEVLELLNGCGLTTPAQIRKVVLSNPNLLFYSSERNLKSKFSFFKTFMKKEDITKFVQTGSRTINFSERRIKSGISLLQKLGIEGEALSDLLARKPSLLVTSEERVVESFKRAEDIGLKKGSKVFAIGLRVLLGLGKESLGRKQQLLSSLGFSEDQIEELSRKRLTIFGASEEKIKRIVHFMVKTVGLPLADFVKYPELLLHSLETRIIPRYIVLQALESMQVQVSKRRCCFPKLVKLAEKRFLEEYVNSNVETSSVLQDIYHGRKAEKLTLSRRHVVSLSQRE